MIQLNYRDTRPIYEQIVGSIRSQIAAGILRSGDKLPSVRELAGQLSINPNTIQRAYRELEAKGVIQTIPGKGCFICGRVGNQPDWSALDKAAAALLDAGITQQEILQHLMEGGNPHASNDECD